MGIEILNGSPSPHADLELAGVAAAEGAAEGGAERAGGVSPDRCGRADERCVDGGADAACDGACGEGAKQDSSWEAVPPPMRGSEANGESE